MLILASGNVVHHLHAIHWNPKAKPHNWARDFETFLVETMLHPGLAAEEKVERIYKAKSLKLAHPTIDHLPPILYALGASEEAKPAQILIQGIQNASVSMASLEFGE